MAAILVCDPPRPRSWRTVLRKSPDRFIDKALRAPYLSVIRDADARRESLIRVLGPESASFARPDLVTPVGRPKEGPLAGELAKLDPDVIAVYGTSIIPDDVLGMARSIALNMHTGLSPCYRGVACASWPIVENEPDKVGATVHECTSDVDGGRIFFSGRAELYRGDDLHTVFARAVKAGAAGYCEVIERAAAGTLEGEAQDLSRGREYRGAALGFRAERAARKSCAPPLRGLARGAPPALLSLSAFNRRKPAWRPERCGEPDHPCRTSRAGPSTSRSTRSRPVRHQLTNSQSLEPNPVQGGWPGSTGPPATSVSWCPGAAASEILRQSAGPRAPEMTAIAPAAVQRAVEAVLESEAGQPPTTHLYVHMPVAELPRTTITTDTQAVHVDQAGAILEFARTCPELPRFAAQGRPGPLATALADEKPLRSGILRDF